MLKIGRTPPRIQYPFVIGFDHVRVVAYRTNGALHVLRADDPTKLGCGRSTPRASQPQEHSVNLFYTRSDAYCSRCWKAVDHSLTDY